MKGSEIHNGFAIALAWPETFCKQAGSWYDILMYYLGINRAGYYKVGHAAIVLVDDETRSCQYFDFGRYHAPNGFGRVRSAETDHDLRIETKSLIINRKLGISNLKNILSELHSNSGTHGTGTIYAKTTRINVDSSISFIKRLQEKEFIQYGPFNPKGTNCSRFVRRAILVGKPQFMEKLKLLFPLTISPTPMWNLSSVGGELYSYDKQKWEPSKILIYKDLELVS